MKGIFTQPKRRRRHERPSRPPTVGMAVPRLAAKLSTAGAVTNRRRPDGFPDRPVGMASSRLTGLIHVRAAPTRSRRHRRCRFVIPVRSTADEAGSVQRSFRLSGTDD
jgi:hypothetical protein